MLDSPRGRGAQMNVGARAARGDVLLFLHADTRLPEGYFAAMQLALQQQSLRQRQPARCSPLEALVSSTLNPTPRCLTSLCSSTRSVGGGPPGTAHLIPGAFNI